MRLIVRLLEIVFWVVIVLWLLRLLFGHSLRIYFGSTRNRPAAPSTRGGETFRDPVCGTYVSPEVSLSALFEGKRVHFCSQECMDRYRSQFRADQTARSAARRGGPGSP